MILNQKKTCDIEMPFCDLQTDCENCPLYMNDCDGNSEKEETDSWDMYTE